MKQKFKKLLTNSKTILEKIKLHKKSIATLEPEMELEFKYIQGITLGNMYMRMYVSKYKNFIIFKQTNTKRSIYGFPVKNAKPITFYFIEGHDKEYKKLSDLIKLLDTGKLK